MDCLVGVYVRVIGVLAGIIWGSCTSVPVQGGVVYSLTLLAMIGDSIHV
jgi:hypothetical protein